MKSLMCMCGVYSRFVADFAKIAKPLTALTSTKIPKKLPPPSGKETDAFEIFRVRLFNACMLALHKRHGHYIVDVDVCYEQLGCCVQQQRSDREYHPIGYYSRALLHADKNYDATELETLGVVWAMRFGISLERITRWQTRYRVSLQKFWTPRLWTRTYPS